MKKLGFLICLVLLLCGCGKETEEDILKDFMNTVNGAKSYKIEGTMEISNDEETFIYSLETYYLEKDYYKVIMVNQTNNHEQIILKTEDDIYVITPSLNKSFKFQSDWPDNSSQAYLLDSLVVDVNSDTEREIEVTESGYIIKSVVNYPNNEELVYQKIYLNSDKIPEKVEVYDENDIVKIKVTFEDIDLKAGLSINDFNLDDYIEDKEEGIDNNTTENSEAKNNIEDNCTEENCETEESENTAIIDDIIYPLYIPSNTYLTSSETVTTNSGNRVILTFGGEKSFVLIEEIPTISTEMAIVPVYGDPLMLSETIGAVSANSLSWDVNNISYYLASTDLTIGEMRSIANSLGNATLVSSEK